MYITTGVCFTSFWMFSKNQVIQLNYSYYPSCHQCPSCQAQEILSQFSWILFMSGQLHKPTGESKAPCLKTCQLLLLIPLPSYPTFQKSESLLRFLGSWATPGRKRKAWGNKGGALDPITAYGDVGCRLGWENQPYKGSWLWESCHALEHLGGVRRGDKIWKHDMLHYLARLEQYTPHVFSPSSHLHVWSPKGCSPLRARMV